DAAERAGPSGLGATHGRRPAERDVVPVRAGAVARRWPLLRPDAPGARGLAIAGGSAAAVATGRPYRTGPRRRRRRCARDAGERAPGMAGENLGGRARQRDGIGLRLSRGRRPANRRARDGDGGRHALPEGREPARRGRRGVRPGAAADRPGQATCLGPLAPEPAQLVPVAARRRDPGWLGAPERDRPAGEREGGVGGVRGGGGTRRALLFG